MQASAQCLFAYGTLMFAPVMQAVCGGGPPAPPLPARLHGYQRYRVAGEVYPAIIAAAGAVVEGVLYGPIGRACWARLDAFETDRSVRTQVTVDHAQDHTLTAWTYVLAPTQRSCLSNAVWSPEEFAVRHLAAYLGDRYTP